MIQQIIRAGDVTVNGNIVKQSFQLNSGDQIDLILPPIEKPELISQDIPLDIIYEDSDIIVINKQAGIIVHPARSNRDGTLVNALLHHCGKENLSSGQHKSRPGIVHRLDKNTTGVMVIAKNDNAQSKIAQQFQDRTTKKNYLAIVQGTPELTADCINAPIGPHSRIRERYAVRHETGKPSITFYEVLEEFSGYSLLQLNIKTGRTHQIRVHMSYIKHPIVGDDMYDGKLVYPWQLKNESSLVEPPVINRPMLHAYTLDFQHPVTGHQLEFEAPVPEDFRHLLAMLRQYRQKSD